MERHDPARDARDEAAEVAQGEGPASPDQHDENFATGVERPGAPEEEMEPNFARGVSAEPPGGDRKGRFSTGEEVEPENPENNIERRFSEGIERSPTSD
jgi:hypothetical protein